MAVKTPAPQRAAGRRKLAAQGAALPDGSFPIPDVPYLKKAIKAVGRAPASKRPALKALIRKRASELKATNAPGVKGTWPFQAANDTEAIDLATMPRKRMPMVRGAADVQMRRTGPGAISVMHKSSGMKVGAVTAAGSGWQGVHADGTKTPASGSQQGALAGLIAYHNQQARKFPPADQGGTASYANDGKAVDLAGALPHSTPAVTSGDGPKVTTMGGAGKPASGMPAEVALVYKKLIKKGLSPKAAMAMAKRAATMHAKAAAKAA